jgi:hypothetical protein
VLHLLEARCCAEGCATRLLRLPFGEPKVSDICELGRGTGSLRREDFGEVWELPRLRVWVTAERGLLKENESNDGDSGDVAALFRGGSGAGLGLTKRSGSSATSSRLGLKGSMGVFIAESSGVVRACPT